MVRRTSKVERMQETTIAASCAVVSWEPACIRVPVSADSGALSGVLVTLGRNTDDDGGVCDSSSEVLDSVLLMLGGL
jgi:hypothetical protein